jgi:hypothetical protein
VIRQAAVVAIYPAYSAYWAARYALLQPTWPRRVGMFMMFLPVIAFMSLIWLGTAFLLCGAIQVMLGR